MSSKRSLVAEFLYRVLVPSLLAAGGIAVLLLYVVNSIFEETDRLDSEYARQTAMAAIGSLRKSLEVTLEDNAVWDDAVSNVYGTANTAWLDENWGLATKDGAYDAVFVVDTDGKTLFSAAEGIRLDQTAQQFFGASIETLFGQLASGSTEFSKASGVFKTGAFLSIAAVGPVLPITGATQVPGDAARLLILAKTLDKPVLDELAADFAVDGMTLSTSGEKQNTSAKIQDITGKNIGSLSWTERNPGSILRKKYGSVISMMLMLFLFVISVLLYMSWRGFKEAHDSQRDAVAASLRDDLTGLANRREMLAVLNRNLADARKDGTALSVIYADLDGFKEVNDSYGHEIGDLLLKATAAGFAYLGRDAEVIARLGGDEFAMILTGPDSKEKARAIAANMISFLEEPMIFDGRIASVSVSAGIVDLEADEADVEEIIRRADVAMYAAKAGGRNQLHVYQRSLDFKRDENRSIATRLREHIDRGRLSVVYQPIVDARSRQIKGVEALVRWPADAPIVYTPDVFIPVAEEFGLIEDLGYFVLSEACRQAVQWDDIFVAVNVSPIQFMNPNFGDLVESTLRRTGLQASRLEIEVTEGFIIDNAARANNIINRLHDMRVRVALDDFGTGFSSIGHLRRFKFDKLKLDRSMVSDILRQPASLRLVQGTIAMADALGLSVVAEGIEDENQVSVLRLAGCNQFQGFLFSRPVDHNQINIFLEDAREASTG